MTNLRRQLPLFSVAVLLLSCPLWAADQPEWKPAESDLPKLAEAVSEPLFTIRPPVGFERQAKKGPNGAGLVSWVSPPREDGSRGYVMAVVVPLPPEELNKYRLEVQLDKLLVGISARRRNWKQSRPVLGKINGAVFARAYWEGQDKETGYDMCGYYYLTRFKGGLLGFSGQDLLQNKDDNLRLSESSALTVEVTP